jgi:hypothetical protein
MDMAGNAQEWVSDFLIPHRGTWEDAQLGRFTFVDKSLADPQGPTEDEYWKARGNQDHFPRHVLRGGLTNPAIAMRSIQVLDHEWTSTDPSTAEAGAPIGGIRCAQSLPSPTPPDAKPQARYVYTISETDKVYLATGKPIE